MGRQWEIAAGRAVKIEVRKDGWYRVARTRLERAGADFTAPGRLRLFERGKEIPILVQRGAIEFYGRAAIPVDGHAHVLVGQGGRSRAPDRRRRSRASRARASRAASVHARSEVQDGLLDAPERRAAELLRRPDLREADDARPRRAGPRRPKRDARRRRPGAVQRDHSVAVTVNGRALGAIAFGPLAHVADSSRFRGACSMSERTS